MKSSGISFNADDGITWVIVDRPDKMNTLTRQILGELKTLFERLRVDPSTRAVIFTGSGDKAFIAGADIAELEGLEPTSGELYALAGQELTNIMENLGKPIIAAINGYALGGGTELALACHIRLASENAKMGLPEVKLGLIPGFGGTQRLARLVGRGKALELILTGRMVDAVEALKIGLVNAVFSSDDLHSATEKLARVIISNGRFALENSLKAVNRGMDLKLDEGLKLEASLFGGICGTKDAKEGTRAFLEKRNPHFD